MDLQGERSELLEVERSDEVQVQPRELEHGGVMALLSLVLGDVVHGLQSAHEPGPRCLQRTAHLLRQR